MTEAIKIRGARAHNLKNIDVDIPLRKLTCVSGASGSGKTSLFFHTLINESKRRFINSFPNDLKFFADRPIPVDVDSISPVLPGFGLPQINPILGSRPTVLDVIGTTEKLANLFFLLGKPYCPVHKVELLATDLKSELKRVIQKQKKKISDDEVVHIFVNQNDYKRAFPQAPLPSRSWDEENKVLNELKTEDAWWEIKRFRSFGLSKVDFDECLKNIYSYAVYFADKKTFLRFEVPVAKSCPVCDYNISENITAKHLTPLSPLGACHECKGYGSILIYARSKYVPNLKKSLDKDAVSFFKYKKFQKYRPLVKKIFAKNGLSTSRPFGELPDLKWELLEEGSAGFPGIKALLAKLEKKKYKKTVRIFLSYFKSELECPSCKGMRLRPECLSQTIEFNGIQLSYGDFLSGTLGQLRDHLKWISLNEKSTAQRKKTEELIEALNWSVFLGLGNMLGIKKIKQLTPGEYQRCLLLKHICFSGVDCLFVFDEPSLGLTQDEQLRVISGFRKLCAQGNTVVVIDHSRVMQKMADFNLEMGPGSGHEGGFVTYQGKYQATETDLSHIKTAKKIEKGHNQKKCSIKGAQFRGFPAQNFSFPLHSLVAVRGDSDSGKSYFILNTLADKLQENLTGDHLYDEHGEISSLKIDDDYKSVVIINPYFHRSSSRSTFGSISGLADQFRKYLVDLPASRALGLKDGHFSQNSKLGQCHECEGRGFKQIEMQFLEDIILECEACGGKKLNPVYAAISDGRLNAHDYFHRPLASVIENIRLTPKFKKIWEYVRALNLGHLSLSRTINTLSGGEKQRVHFLSMLMDEITDSFIFCENLSFGLSEQEVVKLLVLLKNLTNKGNSIVVIDQHEIVLKCSDYELNFAAPIEAYSPPVPSVRDAGLDLTI